MLWMFQLAGISFKIKFPFSGFKKSSKSQVKLYYLEWFDVDARLVLFLDGLDDALDDELGDVVHVTPALRGGDAVHEGHLLEPRVKNTNVQSLQKPISKCFKNAVLNRMCPLTSTFLKYGAGPQISHYHWHQGRESSPVPT
jgi:hypothetical protein